MKIIVILIVDFISGLNHKRYHNYLYLTCTANFFIDATNVIVLNILFFLGFQNFPPVFQNNLCSEIERQNPQTAVPSEPTWICCSRRQQMVCCICKQNSQHLCEFSNCPRLDKKQVVNRMNKRNEM